MFNTQLFLNQCFEIVYRNTDKTNETDFQTYFDISFDFFERRF